MLCIAIRQTLICRNVLRENSSKFNDVKVSGCGKPVPTKIGTCNIAH